MNTNIFYCYSPTLCKELKNIGEKYIAKTTHPETHRECWMFLFTDNLKKYLDQRPKVNHKYVKNTKNPKFN